jgi:hypothetical protein
MPAVLLPLTAAPFAPRSPPSVVLNTVVNPWLTQTLKRVNRLKRPLNSVPQHTKCLTEILSGPSAVWNLCSILVPREPESQIEAQSNTLSDAMYKYQFIHVQAYVVSIDMVMSNEIAYKLTPETISNLVEYHKDVYMVDQAECTWQWSEKEANVKSMHEDFVQAVNKYVFRTDKVALEGIEDDGSGELLCGQSEEVRKAVMGLFLPLLPPPPKVVEVRAPVMPMIPSSPGSAQWWAPTPPINPHLLPVESWKVLPSNNPPVLSSNAPAATTSSSPAAMTTTSLPNNQWTFCDFQENNSSYGLDSIAESSSGWWSSPQSTPSPQIQHQQLPLLPTTAAYMNQLPNMPMASCGTSMGFGGFGWENGRFADYASTM